MAFHPVRTPCALTASMLALTFAVSGCGDGAKEASGTSSGSAAAQSQPPEADRQMQAVLDQHAALNGKPIETLSPSEARRQPTPADAVAALMKKNGTEAPKSTVTTADRNVKGAAGDLPARVYTPAGATGAKPALLYFHGGGFVIADKDVYDSSARALAEAGECVVLSVDYRLAPEHKFPAAHDDAIAAYRWLIDNAATIGVDPKRIAVGGESAGANLAANVAIAARDQGIQAPVHALLVYPMASSDMQAPSYQENANAKPLNKAMMTWFGEHYFRTPADAKDPRIDLVAANLKGLPPTTIITAEIDPLRSGDEQLAAKLKAADVTVGHQHYDGVTHEFFGMGAVVDEAKDAVAYAGKELKKSFGAERE